MEKVTAYRGYAIYANYDGNAPDTKDLILVATTELAEEICAELNEDPAAHGYLAYVEGYESCKRFKWRETYDEDEEAFATTNEDAVAE